jgi:hypothetical protein
MPHHHFSRMGTTRPYFCLGAGRIYLVCEGCSADIFLFCRLFGFLLGSTLAGASVYYYILEEYKVSNELLTEDIYVCASTSVSIAC